MHVLPEAGLSSCNNYGCKFKRVTDTPALHHWIACTYDTGVPVTCSESTPCTQRSRAHLGMLEDVHDEDGKAQAEDVGRKAGVEVGVGVLLQASVMACGDRGGR